MIPQPPLVPPLVTRGCRSLDSCLFVLSGACRAVCRLRAPGRISAAVPCVFVTTLCREQHAVRVCMYCGYLSFMIYLEGIGSQNMFSRARARVARQVQ